MTMLAQAMKRFFGGVKTIEKPLVAPEPVYGAARPMTGLFAQLSKEQREKVLGYQGPENMPCSELPRLAKQAR